MASLVLAAGEKGHRIALPHSRVMIHQPSGGSSGQSSDIQVETAEVLRIRRQVGRIYAERTGKSLTEIAKALDRDTFLSAAEAKEFGLVDSVASGGNLG